MYVCMYVCIYMYINEFVWTYIQMYKCIMYVYIMCVCIYIFLQYMSMNVCVYGSMYVQYLGMLPTLRMSEDFDCPAFEMNHDRIARNIKGKLKYVK